jgi:hypothetical protein
MNAQTKKLPFDLERITYATFRRWVWILSGSKESFYLFEKRYEVALLSMYQEGL